MELFGSGFPFEENNDNDNPQDDEQLEENGFPENINDSVEDDSSEEVDSEEDEENEGSDEDDKGDSSSNLYSSLASVIHEQGLLPSLDIENTKIETIEDLVTVLSKEQEIQAQAKLEEYINNIDVSAIAQSKKEIQDLNKIDENVLKENLELAKDIIYKDYLNQGLGEQKASRLLKRLVDLGEEDLLEEASESLTSLKEFQGRKIEQEKENYLKQVEAEKEAQVELEKQIKSAIYDNKEPLKGMKTNKALQDKVHKSITEIVGKAPDGTFENKFMRDRRLNPVEFEAKMYYLYEMTDGFTNYSKIATTAKSKAVTELERAAKQAKVQDSGTPNYMQDNQSYFGTGDWKLNL